MKKVILTMAVSFFLMSFDTNEIKPETVKESCDELASSVIEMWENENGCMTSEHYNVAYDFIMSLC
ncbi:hypothetical protein [Tenacibaculum ovolyticum]|uniref:hypothetical protein n=1 Tax=Tenacibaculum ovolyticum TaxID=104270 RepID=UPI003BA902AB